MKGSRKYSYRTGSPSRGLGRSQRISPSDDSIKSKTSRPFLHGSVCSHCRHSSIAQNEQSFQMFNDDGRQAQQENGSISNFEFNFPSESPYPHHRLQGYEPVTQQHYSVQCETMAWRNGVSMSGSSQWNEALTPMAPPSNQTSRSQPKYEPWDLEADVPIMPRPMNYPLANGINYPKMSQQHQQQQGPSWSSKHAEYQKPQSMAPPSPELARTDSQIQCWPTIHFGPIRFDEQAQTHGWPLGSRPTSPCGHKHGAATLVTQPDQNYVHHR